ncbi:MAG: hypothetical protein HUU15_04870 [Candidatus Brocadiae bacterium]|nr:hypothetical protein [Candidatus Brocadiia bacterium]
MNGDDVVRRVIDGLDRIGVDYMVVGSYASNAWGRPRGSYDADLVVRTSEADTRRIREEFQDEFALEPEALARDLAAGRMFNLIPRSGYFKVDLIPLRDTEFAREEFSRRRRVSALGREVFMASPEDTILSKLDWYRKGNQVSARQVEDARDIYTLQRSALNEAYLDEWAHKLGIEDALARVRA